MPAGAWAPEATDLAALGTAGRRLIAAVLARYEVALVEGCVLIEAGHAADALTIVRAAQPDVVTQRLELQLSKHYAALLAQLHLEKV